MIYPHDGCHIEAARRQVSIADVRSSQKGQYAKAIAERLREVGITSGRIGVTAADRMVVNVEATPMLRTARGDRFSRARTSSVPTGSRCDTDVVSAREAVHR